MRKLIASSIGVCAPFPDTACCGQPSPAREPARAPDERWSGMSICLGANSDLRPVPILGVP